MQVKLSVADISTLATSLVHHLDTLIVFLIARYRTQMNLGWTKVRSSMQLMGKDLLINCPYLSRNAWTLIVT